MISWEMEYGVCVCVCYSVSKGGSEKELCNMVFCSVNKHAYWQLDQKHEE